jgi:hypothetical protein
MDIFGKPCIIAIAQGASDMYWSCKELCRKEQEDRISDSHHLSKGDDVGK